MSNDEWFTQQDKRLAEKYGWTADSWRQGTELRGETYSMYLRKLAKEHNMEVRFLNLFYRDLITNYRQRHNLTDDDTIGQAGYIELNHQFEAAIARGAMDSQRSPFIKYEGRRPRQYDYISSMNITIHSLRWLFIVSILVIILASLHLLGVI